MAVLQMQKLCICALKKDRKSLMEFLQAAGVLELTAEAEPDEVFKRTDTLEDRQKFERNAATADRALEVLAAVVPEETSMLAGLAGKPLAKAGAYRETEAKAEALLGQAERILNLQKQITEEKTAALRLLAEAESLKSARSAEALIRRKKFTLRWQNRSRSLKNGSWRLSEATPTRPALR